MQVLPRINGVTCLSTGWMDRRFESQTRTKTVLTLGYRSADAERAPIRLFVSLS